jgi:hypothetical protein
VNASLVTPSLPPPPSNAFALLPRPQLRTLLFFFVLPIPCRVDGSRCVACDGGATSSFTPATGQVGRRFRKKGISPEEGSRLAAAGIVSVPPVPHTLVAAEKIFAGIDFSFPFSPVGSRALRFTVCTSTAIPPLPSPALFLRPEAPALRLAMQSPRPISGLG